MQETLTIDGQRFELLGLQRGGAAVYRGESAYLRLGPKEAIERDLLLHRAMEKAKFPVAKIISDGELHEGRYFIEASVGDRSFRAIFQSDVEENGRIADEHFSEFLAMMKKMYTQQKKASHGEWEVQEFERGIHLSDLCRELPSHGSALREHFNRVVKRLARLPRTLTHGDCNPANIYSRGIIDIEDSFYGPLGYDIVSSLSSIEWSPDVKSYEFYAQYQFSAAEKAAYMKAFRTIAPHFDDLAFCRAVWLCAGMHKWPRIQQWRFEKLIHEYLS